MNKAQEIEALETFAASLPAGSYLRGWLGAVLPEIVADIRGDIFPSVVPADMRVRLDAMEKQAVTRAAELVERGKRDAAALVAEAARQNEASKSWVERHKARFLSAVHSFKRELES